MSQEKTYKSEDERITELEQHFMTVEDRLARIEKHLTGGGQRPGFESITFFPFYMPMKGDLISEDTSKMCFEDITTPMDGEHVYQTVAANAACPAPTPAQKAQAAIKARTNLMTFAKTWCAEGESECRTRNGCTPVLSGIKVNSYTPGSRAKEGRKECFVTASITGTVSCRCT